MWKLLIFYTIMGLVAAEQTTFNNYKVIRFNATTLRQAKLFYELTKNHDGVSRFFKQKDK